MPPSFPTFSGTVFSRFVDSELEFQWVAFNLKEVTGSGPVPHRVKASIRLGSRTYCVGSSEEDVPLSAALCSTMDEVIGILKEYIGAHNVPNDVPDEVDVSEDEEEEVFGIPEKPCTKSKKTRLS